MQAPTLQASRRTKKTPAGEIPVDWEWCHLRDVVERLESGVSVVGEERPLRPGELGVLKVSAVTSGQFQPREAKAVVGQEVEKLRTRVAGDSVLVNRANGSQDLVGSAVYVVSAHPNLFLSDKLWQIRPFSDRVIGKYLGLLLSAASFQRRVLDRSSGGTGMLNISSGSYLSIPIAVPPRGEQEQIVRILTALDALSSGSVASVDAAKRRKLGLMQQLLSGRVRFREFKGGQCRSYRLGELFMERVEMGRSDLPLVAITGQNGVVPRDTLAKRDTSSEDKSKYLRIAPGDIGYNTMRMWQGVAGLSKIEGIVSPAYTICIPNEKIDGRFAAYLFKHAPMINLFRRYSQGLVDDTLSLKFPSFAEIHVKIPSVPEQRRIAEVIETCDREIELLQKELNALREQKRGLMQKLLTGELRVKPERGKQKGENGES